MDSRSFFDVSLFRETFFAQLNRNPEDSSNNLTWNIGHIIATQHKLIYTESDAKVHIPDEVFLTRQFGTKPIARFHEGLHLGYMMSIRKFIV